MAVSAMLTLSILCFITHIFALLFHGENIPGQSTTIGSLGKDATLSHLVQDVLDLKAKVKSQEQEIQTLKNQKLSEDNVTTSTVNKLVSEYVDMKTAFGLMKQKFDLNNSQIELQTLKSKLDTISHSIRYLTLSLQDHEIQDEETNKTIYREFEHINNKMMNEIHNLLINTVSESKNIHDLLTAQQGQILTLRSELASIKHLNTNLMNENQNLHEEILNLTNIESADIQRLEAIQQTTFTTFRSEMATQKSKLKNLNHTFFLNSDYSKYHLTTF